MLRYLIVIVAVAIASSSVAQTPDAAFLQRALGVLVSQRNQAMDEAAAQRARADGLADDLAKANAKINELRDKAPVKPDVEPPK